VAYENTSSALAETAELALCETPLEHIERFVNSADPVDARSADREAFLHVLNAFRKYLLSEGTKSLDETFGLKSLHRADPARYPRKETNDRECTEMYWYLLARPTADKIDAARAIYSWRDEPRSPAHERRRLDEMVKKYTAWLEKAHRLGIERRDQQDGGECSSDVR
jgi:hypothetical protein